MSPFLKIGTIMADFQVGGSWPSEIERLKNSVKGYIKELSVFFRNIAGMSSGVRETEFLSEFIAVFTSAGRIRNEGIEEKSEEERDESVGLVPLSGRNTLAKLLLNRFALSIDSKVRSPLSFFMGGIPLEECKRLFTYLNKAFLSLAVTTCCS